MYQLRVIVSPSVVSRTVITHAKSRLGSVRRTNLCLPVNPRTLRCSSYHSSAFARQENKDNAVETEDEKVAKEAAERDKRLNDKDAAEGTEAEQSKDEDDEEAATADQTKTEGAAAPTGEVAASAPGTVHTMGASGVAPAGSSGVAPGGATPPLPSGGINFSTDVKKKSSRAHIDYMKEMPLPPFSVDRKKVFDEHKRAMAIANREKPQLPITAKLSDGRYMDAKSDRTTPLDLARSISFILADALVCAKVDNVPWDLERTLPEKDVDVELIKFDTPTGKKVFWDTSSHILAQALERKFKCLLVKGGAKDPKEGEGFYYDFLIPDGKKSGPEDIKEIDKICQQIMKDRQTFDLLQVPKDLALKMFSYNSFKLDEINKVPDGGSVNVYRIGPFIDLTHGPHLPNTQYVRALKIQKHAEVHQDGDPSKPLLQRISGISFPEKKNLYDWEEFQEQSVIRNHKTVGKFQELYHFDAHCPGTPIYLPHGMRIYNKLMEMMRKEYQKRGYSEIMTPTLISQSLWESANVWDKVKDTTYIAQSPNDEATKLTLKPIHKPAHALAYNAKYRNIREFPLKFAEFGALHRGEPDEKLNGLFTSRRGITDDAHIFVTLEMLGAEVKDILNTMTYVYGLFNINYTVHLYMKPNKYQGEHLALWDKVDKILLEVLNAEFGSQSGKTATKSAWLFKLGATGPRIEVEIQDALKRTWPCGFIDIDFDSIGRYNLTYSSDTPDLKKPIMIQRSIIGNVDRFMGILTEHVSGKWPMWISPRQVCIIPTADKHMEYAQRVQKEIRDAGFHCDIDGTDKTFPKRVKEAQALHYNYVLMVGDDERTKDMVNVRPRDSYNHQNMKVPDLIVKMTESVTKMTFKA